MSNISVSQACDFGNPKCCYVWIFIVSKRKVCYQPPGLLLQSLALRLNHLCPADTEVDPQQVFPVIGTEGTAASDCPRAQTKHTAMLVPIIQEQETDRPLSSSYRFLLQRYLWHEQKYCYCLWGIRVFICPNWPTVLFNYFRTGQDKHMSVR